MKIANDPKRILPVLAGKVRELAEPVVRELDAVRPPQAPNARPEVPARRAGGNPQAAETTPRAATLTGWSNKELMAAVKSILKSGRAVARGRFLNIRI